MKVTVYRPCRFIEDAQDAADYILSTMKLLRKSNASAKDTRIRMRYVAEQIWCAAKGGCPVEEREVKSLKGATSAGEQS
jgi:hypothetical protein